MAISVVIPTLDEEASIVATVTRVLEDPQVLECIVVDGGSADSTLEQTARINDDCVHIIEGSRGRAQQMNLGAKNAAGDTLLFLHADTRLPCGFGKSIVAALDDQHPWGGFRQQFEPTNWPLRLVSCLHNLRCRVTGVIYGDQAMFVRREFFTRLGGFPMDTIEDLAFSDRALRVATPCVVPKFVATSSRKFQQLGEFRALWHVISIIRRYERNKRIGNERFFKLYR